jgi:hypothetical protein
VHLVLDLLEMAEGRESGFMDGRARLEMNVLREQAQSHAARANHVSAIRRLFAALRPTSPTCSPGLICNDAPRSTSCEP